MKRYRDVSRETASAMAGFDLRDLKPICIGSAATFHVKQHPESIMLTTLALTTLHVSASARRQPCGPHSSPNPHHTCRKSVRRMSITPAIGIDLVTAP